MLDVRVLADPPATHAALHDLTKWAEAIDLTYAWASSAGGAAPHWKTLPLARVRRAVIGIHFAQTEPHVLRALHELKVLRVVADTGGVFHSNSTAVLDARGVSGRFAWFERYVGSPAAPSPTA